MRPIPPIDPVFLQRPEAIGPRLRYLRDHVFFESRPAFAERLGMPQTTLKNYESGARDMSWSCGLEAVLRCKELAPYLRWILLGHVDLVEQVDPLAVPANALQIVK